MEEILARTDGAMGKCAGIRFMAGHVTPPSLSSPLTSRQVEGGASNFMVRFSMLPISHLPHWMNKITLHLWYTDLHKVSL